MERTLPALMRRAGVDMWVVPMREYNEDPLFTAITSPTTFSARRRTIYVFFDKGPAEGVEKLALGGTSQGNVFKAVRSMKPVAAPAAGSRIERSHGGAVGRRAVECPQAGHRGAASRRRSRSTARAPSRSPTDCRRASVMA